MGLFSKLFGSGGEDAVIGIDVETKRAQLHELSSALSALVRKMRDDDFPTTNPGWQGRIQDLAHARMETDRLEAQPTFDRQDVFDLGTTVRPLYRGEAPDEFRPLAAENERVVAALDALLD